MPITPWYDDLEFVTNYSRDLRSFHHLLQARREAVSQRKERLNCFIVMGIWHLDSYGQIGRMMPTVLWDKINQVERNIQLPPDAPIAMTVDQFVAYFPSDIRWGFSLGNSGLPHFEVGCDYCCKQWKMEDSGNAVEEHSNEIIPLTRFVGLDLRDVKHVFEQRCDAVHRLQQGSPIRNDKWINLDPHPMYPNLKINERGWANSESSDPLDTIIDVDKYVIMPGDEGMFSVTRYYHSECQQKKITNDTQNNLATAITNAGIEIRGVVRLPNEYGSLRYRGPWFLFDTDKGHIKLGWRKRVIAIMYWGGMHNFATGNESKPGIPDYPNEHLYGYEELTNYMKTQLNTKE